MNRRSVPTGREVSLSPLALRASFDDECPVVDDVGVLVQTRTVQRIPQIRIRCGFTREFFELGVDPCLDAFAETVQLLPVACDEDHWQPGSLCVRSLETVVRALDVRAGRLLPVGAAPEDLGALGPRWTYGVFLAALFKHVPSAFGAMRVMAWAGSSRVREWSPFGASLGDLGMLSFRVERRVPSVGGQAAMRGLPLAWVGRHLPPKILAWLAADARLMDELVAALRGEPSTGGWALADIVAQASGEEPARPGSATAENNVESLTDNRRKESAAGTGPGDDHRESHAVAVAADTVDDCIEHVDARRRSRETSRAGTRERATPDLRQPHKRSAAPRGRP